ncbi:unnamed protein product, partial [marine sediment metagenome]
IAIRCKEWDEVEKYLSVLEQIASSEDFHHRKASYLAARNRVEEALVEAEIACNNESPRFETLARKADLLIECNHTERAKLAIDELVPRSRMKRDVKIGLQCKFLLRQDNWREAEILWMKLSRPDIPVPVHQALKKEILNQELADPMTSPVKREEIQAELAVIGEPFQLLLVETGDGED